jgi:hypothetical protein
VNIHISVEKRMGIMGIVLYKRIISAVKREEFVSDRMYIILRGCWCDTIFLNVHAPAEEQLL